MEPIQTESNNGDEMSGEEEGKATAESPKSKVEDEVAMQFLHPEAGTPAAIALEANAKLKVSKFDKGLRKIRGIKHPKIKGFNRKRNIRKFSRNFKGKTIEGIHEQYTLTIGMMLGIRVAVWIQIGYLCYLYVVFRLGADLTAQIKIRTYYLMISVMWRR
jgi:hypothetical protein